MISLWFEIFQPIYLVTCKDRPHHSMSQADFQIFRHFIRQNKHFSSQNIHFDGIQIVLGLKSTYKGYMGRHRRNHILRGLRQCLCYEIGHT